MWICVCMCVGERFQSIKFSTNGSHDVKNWICYQSSSVLHSTTLKYRRFVWFTFLISPKLLTIHLVAVWVSGLRAKLFCLRFNLDFSIEPIEKICLFNHLSFQLDAIYFSLIFFHNNHAQYRTYLGVTPIIDTIPINRDWFHLTIFVDHIAMW